MELTSSDGRRTNQLILVFNRICIQRNSVSNSPSWNREHVPEEVGGLYKRGNIKISERLLYCIKERITSELRAKYHPKRKGFIPRIIGRRKEEQAEDD